MTMTVWREIKSFIGYDDDNDDGIGVFCGHHTVDNETII